ncbi:MAG TPA: SRPBCC family protein [Candidatus Limnocylindrales bacterium]
MIRRALAGIAIGSAIVVGIEAGLRRLGSAAIDPGRPITSVALIRTPIERVWAILADIESQPRWMRDMKTVRLETPGGIGVGTRAVARVRILGLGVDDPVEITAWQPPRLFAIRHLGTFRGSGSFLLEPRDDGRATSATWNETLVAPILPVLAGLLLRPILAAVFRADLRRLGRLAETGSAA